MFTYLWVKYLTSPKVLHYIYIYTRNKLGYTDNRDYYNKNNVQRHVIAQEKTCMRMHTKVVASPRHGALSSFLMTSRAVFISAIRRQWRFPLFPPSPKERRMSVIIRS